VSRDGPPCLRSDAARALAARLPPLLVAAQRVAATVTGGMHGRRRAGTGDSFWQFRRAQPGDAAGSIDWRQSARSQGLFVRESEWSAAQTVWLWCDASASMHWASRPDLPAKADRALLIGLALAAALLRGGEKVAPLSGGLPPFHGTALLGMLAERLAGDSGFAACDAALPRSAELVLVSDFLLPLDQVAARVKALATAGATGHLLQVLDPAEETLPYGGRILFTDPESEATVLVRRAEDLREEYGRKLASHRAGLAAIAAAAGWSFAIHHTDQPPQTALLALHARLSAPRDGAASC
jgi:uncharacterized protein (DUF58 family)